MCSVRLCSGLERFPRENRESLALAVPHVFAEAAVAWSSKIQYVMAPENSDSCGSGHMS